MSQNIVGLTRTKWSSNSQAQRLTPTIRLIAIFITKKIPKLQFFKMNDHDFIGNFLSLSRLHVIGCTTNVAQVTNAFWPADFCSISCFRTLGKYDLVVELYKKAYRTNFWGDFFVIPKIYVWLSFDPKLAFLDKMVADCLWLIGMSHVERFSRSRSPSMYKT